MVSRIRENNRNITVMNYSLFTMKTTVTTLKSSSSINLLLALSAESYIAIYSSKLSYTYYTE